MTDEQFQALAKYEDTFDKALHTGRAPYPGRAAIEMMLGIMRGVNPKYKTNLNCGVCVLHLVQDVARKYFGDKQDREREAAKKSAEQAEVQAQEEKPAPKKSTPRKKKTDANPKD